MPINVENNKSPKLVKSFRAFYSLKTVKNFFYCIKLMIYDYLFNQCVLSFTGINLITEECDRQKDRFYTIPHG